MPSGTYSLRTVFDALGLKSQGNVIPQLSEQLVPTLVAGNFATFAPQAIEARGIVTSDADYSFATNNNYTALFLQSLAEGGTLIEDVFVGYPGNTGFRPQLHVAAAFPAAALAFPVRAAFSVGGQAISNIAYYTNVEQPGVMPVGDTSIPSSGMTYYIGPAAEAALNNHRGTPFRDIYVPPGGGFWVGIDHLVAANQTTLRAIIRWREFPEPLGPP